MNNFIRLLSLSLLVTGVALASVVVTESQAPHELRSRGAPLGEYATHQECLDAAEHEFNAAKVPVLDFECVSRSLLHVAGACDAPPPPLPAATEHSLAELLQPDGSILYVNYETAWVSAKYPACWDLGRAPLKYHNDADTPQVMDPMPWLEGFDFPLGAPCPAEAGSCYNPLAPK